MIDDTSTDRPARCPECGELGAVRVHEWANGAVTKECYACDWWKQTPPMPEVLKE